MLWGGGIWYKKSTIIIVILLLTLTIGISFAYWQRTTLQPNKNLVTTNCLELEYTDKNEINLEKTYPISNEDGKKLVPYEFTIQNVCERNIAFSINIEVLNETTFEDFDYIKVMLNESDPELLNTKPEVQTTLSDASHSYFLKTSYLAGKESKSYKLRLWLDENTPTEKKYMNQTFASKIIVVSNFYEKEIDKTPPVANFTTTAVNGGYLVDARTSTDDSSGIKTYYYSKDGINWIASKEENYVLKDNTTIPYGKATDVITNIVNANVYDIYVKVEDNFENMSEVVKKSVRPRELAYDETADNNLRYVGASPNNYVSFNNELWRIIGVMNHVVDADGNLDNKIKIVKNSNSSNGYYNNGTNNNWNSSLPKNYLNGTYLNELAAESKKIFTAKWYLGALNSEESNTSEIYIKERNTTNIWDGKIGLVYPSDVRFSVGGTNRNKCLALGNGNEINECSSDTWLANIVSFQFWCISPSSTSGKAYLWSPSRTLLMADWTNGIKNTLYVPTLYLNSNVKITGGQGTSNNPFTLELSE